MLSAAGTNRDGTSSETTSSEPLLRVVVVVVGGGGGGGGGEQESERLGWWKIGVLELKEAKKQGLISLPMILTNVFYYLITLVSVMFAGHLGQLELAGATLANSWATVTGFAFMVN